MKKKMDIEVKGISVSLLKMEDGDYISLTDIAKWKNKDDPRFVVQKWFSTKYTIQFLGIWEEIHNENFNRTEFGAVKNEAGINSFSMSPNKRIKIMNAIGVRSKAGRYGGGTFAHKDIAFEFASWISPEFKLFLIKEFQRLKEQESKELNRDVKRFLTKMNYKIHTDAIKQNLIPNKLSLGDVNMIYANEADVLNKALFGMTAKQRKDKNIDKKGSSENIRDYASIEQLIILANIESMNAKFIEMGLKQVERLGLLNQAAITQMQSLLGVKNRNNYLG